MCVIQSVCTDCKILRGYYFKKRETKRERELKNEIFNSKMLDKEE